MGPASPPAGPRGAGSVVPAPLPWSMARTQAPCRSLLPLAAANLNYPPICHPAAAAECPAFPIIPQVPGVFVPLPSAACRAAQEPPGRFPGLAGVAGEWGNPAGRSPSDSESGLPSATSVQWSRRPDVYGAGTYAHDAVGIIATCRCSFALAASLYLVACDLPVLTPSESDASGRV